MMLFVHIPKTGGTSLVNSLHHSGFRMRNGDEERKAADPLCALYCAREVNADFLYLHEPYDSLKNAFRSEECIVFFREPVQRVLSYYNHRLRDGERRPFKIFVSDVSNKQTRFVQDLALDMAFVGITELYTESLKRLSHKLGRPIPELVLNVNPSKVFGKPYTPTPEELDWVRECNQLDIELYNRMRRGFETASTG